MNEDRKPNEPRAPQAREHAREAGEHVREAGEHAKQAGPAEVERAAERGREQARESVGSMARALRAASDALRDEDHGRMSDMSRQAAEQMDRLAGYIDRKDYQALLDDVRRFGRERPALFLGGMFVTGMLAGRFLRAKSPERRHESESGSPQPTARPVGRELPDPGPVGAPIRPRHPLHRGDV